MSIYNIIYSYIVVILKVKKNIMNIIMKCKECGMEIEENTAVKHGCLKCGDKTFVDRERQAEISNKYVTNAQSICHNGKCQGLKAWSIELGISYNTLNGRKWRGLSVEEIFKK